jgi:hypothetical protein
MMKLDDQDTLVFARGRIEANPGLHAQIDPRGLGQLFPLRRLIPADHKPGLVGNEPLRPPGGVELGFRAQERIAGKGLFDCILQRQAVQVATQRDPEKASAWVSRSVFPK